MDADYSLSGAEWLDTLRRLRSLAKAGRAVKSDFVVEFGDGLVLEYAGTKVTLPRATPPRAMFDSRWPLGGCASGCLTWAASGCRSNPISSRCR
jgi:hypothetical protein